MSAYRHRWVKKFEKAIPFVIEELETFLKIKMKAAHGFRGVRWIYKSPAQYSEGSVGYDENGDAVQLRPEDLRINSAKFSLILEYENFLIEKGYLKMIEETQDG